MSDSKQLISEEIIRLFVKNLANKPDDVKEEEHFIEMEKEWKRLIKIKEDYIEDKMEEL